MSKAFFELERIDPATSEALAAMVRAAAEHHAQCVLAGVHGELVPAELRGLVTTSSLKTGLQHCIKRPH